MTLLGSKRKADVSRWNGQVWAASISPDSTQVLAGLRDHTIRLRASAVIGSEWPVKRVSSWPLWMSSIAKLWCWTPVATEDSLKWIDRTHPALSVRRQCELLGIHRSTLFYEPVPETPENLELMQLIDAKCLKHPFYGTRSQGFPANPATCAGT